MTKKTRKTFSQKIKDQAVDAFLSGEKSAQQIADEIGCDVQLVYRWKVSREEKAKGIRIDELVKQGHNKDVAQKLLEKELEIEAYQKKVAEQAIIIDLLKNSPPLTNSQQESELTGLIRTSKLWGIRKKGVK